MSNKMLLRNVANDALPSFFEYQLDQEANTMAVFTARDPTNSVIAIAVVHARRKSA